MRFFTTPDSLMHSVSMYFPTMTRRGLRPRRGQRPKAAALIVGNYIEIECLGGVWGGEKSHFMSPEIDGEQNRSPCACLG